jgi:hypothetical protein
MSTPELFEESLERGLKDLGHVPAGVHFFAHIEGLTGEEDALLKVPPHERTPEQHARLHAISHELDRLYEHLAARAKRRHSS